MVLLGVLLCSSFLVGAAFLFICSDSCLIWFSLGIKLICTMYI